MEEQNPLSDIFGVQKEGDEQTPLFTIATDFEPTTFIKLGLTIALAMIAGSFISKKLK